MDWVMSLDERTRVQSGGPDWGYRAPRMQFSPGQSMIEQGTRIGTIRQDILPCPDGCSPFPADEICDKPHYRILELLTVNDSTPISNATCPSGHIWSLNARVV